VTLPPFHLALCVRDLAEARAFYGELFGCPEGRSSADWVDFDFFGHQLVCHRTAVAEGPDRGATGRGATGRGATGRGATGRGATGRASNQVDGHSVPVPHFGVVLEMERWEQLAARLRAAGVEFVVEPHVRFPGKPGEQATLFLRDPSGNALEFKAFGDVRGQLFER